MKKMFFVLIGACLVSAGYAQVVEQNEPALVYYSPKTAITLDFTYTVEQQVPGIYAQYAEDMIGADNAVKENKTTYTLRDVRIKTNVSPDYSRPHKVVAEPGFPLLLNINEHGLLTGYNLSKPEKETPQRPYHETEKKEQHKSKAKVAPLPEDVLQAANPLAQANAAAKQIFHLRETRMYLINGEVEHAPADGEAMRLVLAELDRQEQALTDLFLGKKNKYTMHKTVRLNPEQAEQLLYFSDENGFTDAENIEADTIKVGVTIQAQQYAPSVVTEKKKKKAIELSQLVYNLPGHSTVNVEYKNKVLGNRTVPMAQYGIDVPLAKDLFKGTELPTIIFSEKTGNIVSISK